MNDPERLLTSDVSERERRLLRAGAREEPPTDGAARLAIALGVAPSSLGLSQPSAEGAPRAGAPGIGGETGAAAHAAGGWATKWIALAGAGVIAAAGTALFVQRTSVERSATNARSGETTRAGETLQVPPTRQAGEATRASGASPLDPAQHGHSATEGAEAARAGAPTRAVRSIADEIAQLERVRVLLTRRDGGGALQLLADYERDNARGALREEALFMRVEALALSGQRADARRSARSFERLYPKSVHGPRVRAIAESLGER